MNDILRHPALAWRALVGDRIRHRARAGLLPLALLGGLAGCRSEHRPLEDREKIVAAVLTLLASDGRPVCIDDQTDGHALAVFEQMMAAPRAARSSLRWHAPISLRPDARVTTRELRRAEFKDEKLVIREPDAREDALPGLAQLELNSAAVRLSGEVGHVEETVAIRQSWAPKGVAARWWALNRVRRDCWPLFEMSDPVRDRKSAFVTVRAEHWGTLYALNKAGDEWRIVAEWSRWLY